MRKKAIVVGIFITIILLLTLKIIQTTLIANQFVEVQVTGRLTALPLFDVNVFWIRVSHPGTMVLTLEKSGSWFGTSLEVNESTGFRQIVVEETPDKTQLVYVTLTEEDLGERGHVDFKVKVKARYGMGEYQLTILKPEETITETFFGDIAVFDIKKTKEMNEIDLYFLWKDLIDGIANPSTLTVKIFDKKTQIDIRETLDNKYFAPYGPGKIEWPLDLPEGEYTVVLEKKSPKGGEPWKVTRQSVSNITSVQDKFVTQIIEAGQTDSYQIQLSGREKYIWIIWERNIESKEHSILEISLKGQGHDIHLNYLVPNNIVLIPLTGLMAGTYQLDIKSQHQLVYSFGVEDNNGFEGLSVKKYTREQILNTGQKYLYDVDFANADNKKINVTFFHQNDQSPSVRVGRIEDMTKFERIELKDNEVKFVVDFDDSPGKGFWVETLAEGVVCRFEIEDYEMRRMDKYEPNNNIASAFLLNKDTNVVANLSSLSDVDYYKFTVSDLSTVEIRMPIVNREVDLNIELLNSAQKKVQDTFEQTNEKRIFGLLQAGTYYIKVTPAKGFSNRYYSFNFTLKPFQKGVWFSQIIHPAANTAQPQWDRTNLDNLYFVNAKNPHMSIAEHFRAAGCVMCAHAMVLRNLGVKTKEKRYDFRTGTFDYLDVDPFVIMMTVLGWPEIKFNAEKNRWECDKKISTAPIFFDYNDRTFINEFGYRKVRVSFSPVELVDAEGKKVKVATNAAKVRQLTDKIKENPEGLVVRIENGDNQHSFVLISSSYEGPDMHYINVENQWVSDNGLEEFLVVCETNSQQSNVADNVLFSATRTIDTRGGIPFFKYYEYWVKSN